MHTSEWLSVAVAIVTYGAWQRTTAAKPQVINAVAWLVFVLGILFLAWNILHRA